MPVRRFDTNDLVGVAEIAQRTNVGRSAVCNWVKRHKDFPAPVARLRQGPIYLWAEVDKWVHQTKRTPSD